MGDNYKDRLYSSEQLQPLTEEQLKRLRQEFVAEQVKPLLSKTPANCQILVVKPAGSYGLYLNRFLAYNENMPPGQQYCLEKADSLEKTVNQLVAARQAKQKYDAVIIPEHPGIEKYGLVVASLEVLLSVKRYRSDQDERDYAKKKLIIKECLPGKTDPERELELTLLRFEYKKTPFVFLYLLADKEIETWIKRRREHLSEERLQTIHFFEVAPGNQPKLYQELAEIIK